MVVLDTTSWGSNVWWRILKAEKAQSMEDIADTAALA